MYLKKKKGKQLIPHDSEFPEETGCGGHFVYPPLLLSIPNMNYRPAEKQKKEGGLKGNSNIFFFSPNPATHSH